MHIKKIDHVQLAMPPEGEAKARKFYQEVLGIPEVPKPPILAKRGGCWFEKEELKVHLGIEQNFHPAQKAHPAFIVEDLTGLSERIERSGFKVIKDGELEGYDRIYTDDPFGNRIELMEPLKR